MASGVLEEALESQEVLMMEADGSIGIDLTERESSDADGVFERDETVPERGVPEQSAGRGHGNDPNVPPNDHTCDSRGDRKSTERDDSQTKRTAIPNVILRQVFARAGHRCECCGRKGGRLDVHHCDPVSEGGRNELERLELLCRGCHTKNHERDFEEKEHWRGGSGGGVGASGRHSLGGFNPTKERREHL